MVCIYCQKPTQVTNSRLQKRLNQTWRRRKCSSCAAIFSTIESVQLESAWIVTDTNNKITPFNRDKLLLSIYKSCQHRPNAVIEASHLTNTIISSLYDQKHTALLTANEITQEASQVLSRFDDFAYNHYVHYHQIQM